MSAHDITKTIEDALATEQNKLNQTKPNGDDFIMAMNQPNQNAGMMNQEGMTQLQKTPTQFNVYDPATGRNWTEDNAGRRITPRRDMTGSQLVAVQSMRAQIGLPMLNNHNVNQMSIDSASRMQDDLRWMIEKIRYMNEEVLRMRAEYKHQVEIIMQQLDECLKDPKVAAEVLMKRQAEQAQNNK